MHACICLDLEPDFGGWIPTTYSAWIPERVQALLRLLAEKNVPLSVFVVGQCLEEQPQVVELFQDAGAEFHLHSFSHDLLHPDSGEEIDRGTAAFTRAFGRAPEGYRAPQGRISEEGWRRLEERGFLFDSSIFPSFWPAPRYLRYAPRPFRPGPGRLLEMPISTISPLRIIVALSWIHLLGWSRFRALFTHSTLPEPLVFNMHLHDLWDAPSYADVPRPWRWLYLHDRDQGLHTLARFLDLLRGCGHAFTTLGTAARQHVPQEAAC
jgi:peptidoglycan/xylan/chitin deacetylase (PgdA/CDA1 family)